MQTTTNKPFSFRKYLLWWLPAAMIVVLFGYQGYVSIRRVQQNRQLLEAIYASDTRTALESLANGADPNVTDDIDRPNSKLLPRLRRILTGSRVAKRARGWSALMHAAGRGNAETVRALLEHGANVH